MEDNTSTVWTFSQKVAWKMPGLMKGIDATAAYNEVYRDGVAPSLEKVVDIARSKKSVIHNYFEWNDKVASENYRKVQAGRMLRNFVLVKENKETNEVEKTNIRVFEVDSSRTGTYQERTFFMRNEDEYTKLLNRAKVDLQAFKDRYSNIIELETIFEAIDEFLA